MLVRRAISQMRAQESVIPVPRARSKHLAQATAPVVPTGLIPPAQHLNALLIHVLFALSTVTGPSAGVCQRTIAVVSAVRATPATMSSATCSVCRAKGATTNP